MRGNISSVCGWVYEHTQTRMPFNKVVTYLGVYVQYHQPCPLSSVQHTLTAFYGWLDCACQPSEGFPMRFVLSSRVLICIAPNCGLYAKH